MSRFTVGAKNLTIRVAATIVRPKKEELMDLGNFIFRAGAKTDIALTYTTKFHGVEYDFHSHDRLKNGKILHQLSLERPIIVDYKWSADREFDDGQTFVITEGLEAEMARDMEHHCRKH